MKKLDGKMLEDRIKEIKRLITDTEKQYQEIVNDMGTNLVIPGPAYKTIVKFYIDNINSLQYELDILEVHLKHMYGEIGHNVEHEMEMVYMKILAQRDMLNIKKNGVGFDTDDAKKIHTLESQLLELKKVLDVDKLESDRRVSGDKIERMMSPDNERIKAMIEFEKMAQPIDVQKMDVNSSSIDEDSDDYARLVKISLASHYSDIFGDSLIPLVMMESSKHLVGNKIHDTHALSSIYSGRMHIVPKDIKTPKVEKIVDISEHVFGSEFEKVMKEAIRKAIDARNE